MTHRIAASIVALGWAAVASAQTTQPAPAAVPAPPPAAATWLSTVEQVAKATEKGNVPLVLASLTPDASVRSFESPEPAAARSMVDAAAEWRLLGAHAYEFPPASLAVDIASDVEDSDLVPEPDKRKIIPLDTAEAVRANSTAAEWVARALGAERYNLVGVAVFWNVRTNRPAFVLMKGQPSARADGAYAVSMAVYGDPMPRRASASR